MESILFVCVGNTCRSVMAEHIARKRLGDKARFESAGINPQLPKDAENAIEALSELGIDASTHIPKSVWQTDFSLYDRIVAMDNFVGRQLKGKVEPSRLEIWRISDPWGPDFEQYTKCIRQLQREIVQLEKRLMNVPSSPKLLEPYI